MKEEYTRYLELLVRIFARAASSSRTTFSGAGSSRRWRRSARRERARVEALREFNAALLGDARLRAVILPLGDGVAYAVKL